MKEISVILLEYGEFEKLVNKEFFEGKNKYCYPDDEEMNNDTNKLYSDINGEFKYDWEKDDLKEIREGKTKFIARDALQELCRKEIIPKGNYLISVCW